MADMNQNGGSIERVIAIIKGRLLRIYAPPRIRRDAHPKVHGLVQAEFIVDATVPPALRHGVFAKPGKYRAWVRFSNAFDIRHDLKADTRGFAVKLLDVEGERLDAGDEENSTQDFVMATHDAFFLPDPREYVEFLEAVDAGSMRVVRFFLSRVRRWRGGWAQFRSMSVLARNPLAIPYSSQTPYQLGPCPVKLRAEPVPNVDLERSLPGARVFRLKRMVASLVMAIAGVKAIRMLAQVGGNATLAAAEDFCDRHIASRDLLRHAMMAFLASHEAEFQILVQRFVDEGKTPINDATRRWRVRHTPFEKMATLRIPRQVFWPESGMPKDVKDATSDMMDLGENMSFNPWHGLEAHRPLGAINEARRHVYPAIVRFRREKNEVSTRDVLKMQGAASYERIREIVQAIAVVSGSAHLPATMPGVVPGTVSGFEPGDGIT